MKVALRQTILKHTRSLEILNQDLIQTLWSGYGELLRISVRMPDNSDTSYILKHISTNKANAHPRGWNGDIGHQRKVKSYHVEVNFYSHFAKKSKARIAACLYANKINDNEIILLLEDLNTAGYTERKSSLNDFEFDQCLKWLASFHASFINHDTTGLWKAGTYWHLDTRPEELEALQDKALKRAASHIDALLNNTPYKTLVHGDAKVANFCFSKEGHVAAVDFQYVGGGCGMKDLVYFVGSVLDEQSCELREGQILDTYFKYFHEASDIYHHELESEWRSLYHVAWADFHRFLMGWSPGHWKINTYSERICKEVISQLK